jgi:hypothetical protein
MYFWAKVPNGTAQWITVVWVIYSSKAIHVEKIKFMYNYTNDAHEKAWKIILCIPQPEPGLELMSSNKGYM